MSEHPIIIIFLIVLYLLFLVVAGIIVCVIIDKVRDFLWSLKKPEPGDYKYQAPYGTLNDADKARLEQIYGAPLPQSFVSLYRNLNILSAKGLPLPSLEEATVARFFPPSELLAVNIPPSKGFSLKDHKDHLAIGLADFIGGIETIYIRVGGAVQDDVRLFFYDYEACEETTSAYLGKLLSMWEEVLAGPRNFTLAEIEKLSQWCGGAIPAALREIYERCELQQMGNTSIIYEGNRTPIRLYHPAEVITLKEEVLWKVPRQWLFIAGNDSEYLRLLLKVSGDSVRDAPVFVCKNVYVGEAGIVLISESLLGLLEL